MNKINRVFRWAYDKIGAYGSKLSAQGESPLLQSLPPAEARKKDKTDQGYTLQNEGKSIHNKMNLFLYSQYYIEVYGLDNQPVYGNLSTSLLQIIEIIDSRMGAGQHGFELTEALFDIIKRYTRQDFAKDRIWKKYFSDRGIDNITKKIYNMPPTLKKKLKISDEKTVDSK